MVLGWISGFLLQELRVDCLGWWDFIKISDLGHGPESKCKEPMVADVSTHLESNTRQTVSK